MKLSLFLERITPRRIFKLFTNKPWLSHSYGMVGFIKQLVDEQAASDVTRKNMSGIAKRKSKFKQIIITSSIVFVEVVKK